MRHVLHKLKVIAACLLLLQVAILPAGAESLKEFVDFEKQDINGNPVSLDKLVEPGPDLAIIYFFEGDTGDPVAQRLRILSKIYAPSEIAILAVGIESQIEDLKKFAEKYSIQYAVISDENKELALKAIGEVERTPITFILAPQKYILRTLVGTGTRVIDQFREDNLALLREVSQISMTQGEYDKAEKVADAAIEAGEDKTAATELKGYVYVKAGKLDQAEKEFSAVDSKAGQATVALERGDTQKAIEIAKQADPKDGGAETVIGTALMREGKLDEAAAAFSAAASKDAQEWQKAEAVNGQARIVHQKGDVDAAITQYRDAQALDPFNIQALSNEGAALRDKGDLKGAEDALNKAKDRRGEDPLVMMMLSQIQQELKEANDIKRRELIQRQIAELSARAKELKAAGQLKPVDPWTSRPLVVAFLPAANANQIFFERAGTDVAIRREIERRLQGRENISVVEREVLDQLLQELDLGSSELADPGTQLQLGKVLAAPVLGFIDFSQIGQDVTVHLRTVEVETTKIKAQITKSLGKNTNVEEMVSSMVDDIAKSLTDKRVLQGLVAQADTESEIMINIGARLGVQPGQKFLLLKDGEPIEVGGRTIAGRPKKVGTIEVVEVDEEFSVCKLVEKSDGVKLAKEMKIRAAEEK